MLIDQCVLTHLYDQNKAYITVKTYIILSYLKTLIKSITSHRILRYAI